MTASELATLIKNIKNKTIENFAYGIENEDTFFPDSSPEDIAEFERKYNLTLPEEIREYLTLFNGEGQLTNQTEGMEVGMYLGLCSLSLSDIKREMDVWKQVWEENPEFEEQEYESIPEDAVNAKYVDCYNWVGLATDGCGNSIGIDLNPGPKGKIGQVIIWGKDYWDDRTVIYENWTDFLKEVWDHLNEEGFFTVDKEYNVYDLPETNYIDYLYEKKLKEYGRG